MYGTQGAADPLFKMHLIWGRKRCSDSVKSNTSARAADFKPRWRSLISCLIKLIIEGLYRSFGTHSHVHVQYFGRTDNMQLTVNGHTESFNTWRGVKCPQQKGCRSVVPAQATGTISRCWGLAGVLACQTQGFSRIRSKTAEQAAPNPQGWSF